MKKMLAAGAALLVCGTVATAAEPTDQAGVKITGNARAQLIYKRKSGENRRKSGTDHCSLDNLKPWSVPDFEWVRHLLTCKPHLLKESASVRYIVCYLFHSLSSTFCSGLINSVFIRSV